MDFDDAAEMLCAVKVILVPACSSKKEVRP